MVQYQDGTDNLHTGRVLKAILFEAKYDWVHIGYITMGKFGNYDIVPIWGFPWPWGVPQNIPKWMIYKVKILLIYG